MWQELPDRGCFFSGGDNYCDPVRRGWEERDKGGPSEGDVA